MTKYTKLIERAKDQRDRDAAEHCPAEIIALQGEVIAGLESMQAENERLENEVLVQRGMARLANGQRDALQAQLDELRAVICGVGIVGKIAGHDVIVRESVIDLIDRRRNAAKAASAKFMGFDVVVDPTLKPNEMKLVQPQEPAACTCPSGDGSLRWPCPQHPPKGRPIKPEIARAMVDEMDMNDRVLAAIDAEPQAPVGRFVSDGDCGYLELVPHQGPPLAGGQYVFAGPQVQAPLTDAQILQAIRNAPKMPTNYAGWVQDQRIAWGRAILAAAHGVGEPQ
jgi:hypothetical protein